MATRRRMSASSISEVDEAREDDTAQVSAPAAPQPILSRPPPPSTDHAPAPVSLDVWVLSSGIKPDQTAGFRRYALSRKLGPRAAPEWLKAYREFLARPV